MRACQSWCIVVTAVMEAQQNGFYTGGGWPPLPSGLAGIFLPMAPELAAPNNGGRAGFPFLFLLHRTRCIETASYCDEKPIVEVMPGLKSFLAEDNRRNNEFKLSKMEIGFRRGDYHSQWRLKLSKWLGMNSLLTLIQVRAIQRVTRPRTKRLSPTKKERRRRPTRNPRLAHPAFQSPSKTFNILPTQRTSERRWWPAKVAGCAHRLVAASKIHQHLAGGDLLPWRGDEGGTAAMASPGSRWPKTEGDGRVHFISKQVFHQAFKGSSTNKGIYNFTLDSGVYTKSSPAVWKRRSTLIWFALTPIMTKK